MTIAEHILSVFKAYQGDHLFEEVSISFGSIDEEGTNLSDKVSYTDGSMLVLEDDGRVASMWDASGGDLDIDCHGGC